MIIEKLTEGKENVIIDIWAEWCGPCKLMKKVLEDIESDYDDVFINKIDIDNTEFRDEIVSEFKIRSIPTLVYVKNNKVLAIETGGKTKDQLINNINKYFKL